MKYYAKYSSKPTKFLAMTGYSLEEFSSLLPAFEQSYQARFSEETYLGKDRRRSFVIYKNCPLPSFSDQLLFILIYLKQATTQEVQASLFDMDQPVAHRWIHRLLPIVNRALADVGEQPARSVEKLILHDGDQAYFHDGTERPIPRPNDPDRQKTFYSGKKRGILSKTTS